MTNLVVPDIAPRDPKPRRHSWPHEGEAGIRRIAHTEFNDGNARTEKTCRLCGLIKITVHSTDGTFPREWRTKDGKTWQGDSTPPCLDSNAVTLREFSEDRK